MVGEGNKANVGKRWQTLANYNLVFGVWGGGAVYQKRCLPKKVFAKNVLKFRNYLINK